MADYTAIDIAGERVELAKDVLIRVAAGTKRKVHAGPEGLQMLVLGGCPGEPTKSHPSAN
jgi:hypothetical protein